MGGVTMAQSVHTGWLAHAALEQSAAKSLLQGRACDGAAMVLHAVRQSVACDRREQPLSRAMRAPQFPQLNQSFVGQRHQALFAAFAPDAQEQAATVHIADL